MREYLGPVQPAQVQTELGVIYLRPGGKAGVQVNAPHLTVDGVRLQPEAVLVSDGLSFKFDLLQGYDLRTQRFSTSDYALHATRRTAAMPTSSSLGRIAQVIEDVRFTTSLPCWRPGRAQGLQARGEGTCVGGSYRRAEAVPVSSDRLVIHRAKHQAYAIGDVRRDFTLSSRKLQRRLNAAWRSRSM
jgi:hypothetical protein